MTEGSAPTSLDTGFEMVEHDDDIVEVFPRRAVSSGSPSSDGSGDDEGNRPASDSELAAVAETDRLARQMKGPSSDALETECAKEHKHRLSEFDRRDSSDSAELVDAAEVATGHAGETATEPTDGWVDILGSKELYRKIIKEGSGVAPRMNQLVTIRMEGFLPDGTKVDCNDSRSFLLGFYDVIDAIEMTVRLMKPGEIDEIKTSSRFAYGSFGRPNEIPPDCDLRYTLELLQVGDGPMFSSMTIDELETFLNERKECGNKYFNRKEFDKAIQVYQRAAKLADADDQNERLDEEDLKKLSFLCSLLQSNIAVCYSKSGDWNAVLEWTDKCLKLDSHNSKALFRRGNAFAMLNQLDQSISCLQQAVKVNTDSTLARNELDRVLALKRQETTAEKQLYSRMMTGLREPQPAPKWRQILDTLADNYRAVATTVLVVFVAWSLLKIV